MEKPVKLKAMIYCIEAGRLLVFRHRDFPPEEVGVQVPGGSVRESESPEAAALRELCEETGRGGFTIERELGRALYDVTPYRREIHDRRFYLARPTAPLPERWTASEDHDGSAPPTALDFFWLPFAAAHVLQSGQSQFVWMLDGLS